MSHPHNLHAEAAWWSTQAARRLLDDEIAAAALQPRAAPGGGGRRRTLAERRAENTLVLQERQDRLEQSRWGYHPPGASPLPVAAHLYDLRTDLATVLANTADMLRYIHRHHPLLHWSPHWTHHATQQVWTLAAIAGAPPTIAQQLTGDLEYIDQRIRTAIGARPNWWTPPLAPPCPACDQRTLRVQTSAPDDRRWTIICTACTCTGGDDCGMDVPARGVRHIWAADSTLATSALAGATLLSREAA